MGVEESCVRLHKPHKVSTKLKCLMRNFLRPRPTAEKDKMASNYVSLDNGGERKEGSAKLISVNIHGLGDRGKLRVNW